MGNEAANDQSMMEILRKIQADFTVFGQRLERVEQRNQPMPVLNNGLGLGQVPPERGEAANANARNDQQESASSSDDPDNMVQNRRGRNRGNRRRQNRGHYSDDDSDPGRIDNNRRDRGGENQRRRNPRQANADGDEPPARNTNHELKLKPPLYAGKVDPEAYIDWEKRMDHIFEVYTYTASDFEYPELDTKNDFPNKIEEGQDKLLVLVEEAEARDHQDHLFSSFHGPWPMIIAQAGCTVTTITSS
ncbi:unnamed protein product [Arabidopsis arenosa]|uniref:Uncharacterized protein n=1 Tax=Arabidopsis arenosa TaxID=38785 RepID=A0A8S2AT96_ARAAE|nr:unnamed protein product [Arabidopsis arenosa]